MASVQTTNGSLQMVFLLFNKKFMIEHLDEKIMRLTYLAILTPRLNVGINIIYHIHMKRDKKHLLLFICTIYINSDTLPSPLLDPSWVQVNQTTKLFGTRGTLPTLNTKRGRGAC
jgi:hypothetical protein